MSEPYYIEKGPVIIVPDPINPDFYQVKKNPEWSQIPEICSFGDFILIAISVKLWYHK